jgi:NAD(P)-dependent dehydrogenase (short-subunit alcohol dehydrogenase family)
VAALTGKVAIVTGAGGKLGPVWMRALSEAGAAAVGLDIAPGDTTLLNADVTDRASLNAALQEITASHGVPSILINNAGIDQPPGPAETSHFEDIDLDGFRKTLDVNLVGTFNACQVFGGAMARAGSGSIVNIGSLYATVAAEPRFYDHLELDPPFLKPPAYGASKAGVVNLTRYLARLWGPKNVRVNVLSPGGVEGGQDPEFVRKYTERTPLGRLADPAELAGPLVFLASDESSYLTGHELRVDGGFTA